MSWTTSNADLRRLLSDGPADKLAARKRVIGELNDENVTFKTFEFRRVQDFTVEEAPFGVYLNGIRLNAGLVLNDFPGEGIFTLTNAPSDGDVLEATYYYQWFLDEEMNDFNLKAAQWLGFGEVVQVVPGLQESALHFAAQSAYLKLAIRWMQNASDTYRLEDSPDPKIKTAGDHYRSLAEFMFKKAKALRDDFYTRQGQNLQPLFGMVVGAARDVQPKR